MKHAYLKTEMSKHEMLLNQMGGDVKIIKGIMCYVKFDIKGTLVEYIYHINNSENYFLQRISPYPMNIGTYPNKDEIISVIKHDINQFKNASNSTVFKDFINVNQKFNNTLRHFEDLYLYYNIPHEIFKKINNCIDEMENLITEHKTKCKRVYFEKDPDTI
ncbi:hypothetical protein [Tepidibacter thalassicus]|uniref:Uncharacterized protein n=1 Tax=Tepidibacter thalassicus DSM 15285 TaxID=1123350 RepID=A0A1M5T765_9FIRM|nr:hypothetical protein [Tepidibacter thalassicus]SHH46542.1 hypothetical protein SAMN02744040_02057 [Tepidibacter thalassicus DSM 15285]